MAVINFTSFYRLLDAYLQCPTGVPEGRSQLMRTHYYPSCEKTHDLELKHLPLQLNSPDFEVYSDGTQVAIGERVLCEP